MLKVRGSALLTRICNLGVAAAAAAASGRTTSVYNGIES